MLDRSWVSSPDFHLYTDASESQGCGAILRQMVSASITWQELFAVVAAAKTWANRGAGNASWFTTTMKRCPIFGYLVRANPLAPCR